jgi:serine/threonine protein kinase
LKYKLCNSNSSKVFDSGVSSSKRVGPHSFKAIRPIGVGSFGEVFLVEKIDSGKLYAMKILKKDKIFKRNLTKYAKAERNVLCITSHPFVVKLFYAFQTADRLFLIMEYWPGGDLGEYIEAEDTFNEQKARFYISEIILAVEDLHKRGIIYRDLKPDNIVLDRQGHAKLTDFGLSKEGMEYIDFMTKSFWGSYAYLAPEMIKKEGHSMDMDWYLLGVVLYEMLEGYPPYYSDDKDELMKSILENDLRIPDHISEEAQDLLSKLLQKEPGNRLGFNDGAAEIKAHPWFGSIDWENVAQKGLKPYFPYLSKTSGELLKDITNRKFKFIIQI